MPILLYCVTQSNENVIVTSGVCDCGVWSQESAGLRVYWSEIATPEECLSNAESMKKAALQFQQVLREILATTTPIPFPFPTLLESIGAFDKHLAAEQELYRAALIRVEDAVQYEIVASWATDEQADLAAPISGREYLKRRQESTGRTAAVDSKLKRITAGSVREWRGRQERKTYRWFALVPRNKREQFMASLRSAGASEGVRLRLSGPWPPSEFLTANRENAFHVVKI